MSEFYSQYTGKIQLIATTKANSKGFRKSNLMIKAAAAINPGEKNSPCDWNNQIIMYVPDEMASRWHHALRFYLTTGDPRFLTQVNDKGFNVNDYMTDRSKSNSNKGKKYAKSSIYGYVTDNNETKFYLYISEWNSQSDKVEIRLPLDIPKMNDLMLYIEGYMTTIRTYHTYVGYKEFIDNNNSGGNRSNRAPQQNNSGGSNFNSGNNNSFSGNVGGSPFGSQPQQNQQPTHPAQPAQPQPSNASGFGSSNTGSVDEFLG